MSYNYQPPPGQYGRPPGFPGYPGGPGAPPGLGAPPGMPMAPGMGAPGMGGAPGMQQAQSPTNAGFPPNFQPSANMPNINFNAPVIRLGNAGPPKPDTPTNVPSRREGNSESMGNRRGAGIGFGDRDQQRDRNRDPPIAIAPPTREEIARTIFIGNITDAIPGEEALRSVLNCAGGLRKWLRTMDTDGKPCTFGFAEYEDADSLATAVEVLKDIEIPVKAQQTNGVKKSETNGIKKEEDDDEEEPEEKKEELSPKAKLLVIIDENSQKYIEEWRGKGSLKDPADAQFRIDSAKEELENILASFTRTAAPDNTMVKSDPDGDHEMHGAETRTDETTGEVVTIPLTEEDELINVPAEMKETVAKEIAAFRDRSIRRDLERLREEERMEQAEKQRINESRLNNVGTPPPSAGSAPNGPRGAPLGPRGYQGAQLPRDYQKGVSFVNGTGIAGLNQADEDSDASDEELERRRKDEKNVELEKLYLDQERRWLNRERSRTAAVEREKGRDKDEVSRKDKERAAVATRLKEWNDDTESSRRVEEYYRDRPQWLRNRAAFRAREAEQDERDRALEEREKNREKQRKNREMGDADQFLARQAEELEQRLEAPREPQRFKMSLGAAAQNKQQSQRRTIAEVEGLLEDEEDAEGTTQKRTLIPIAFDSKQGAGLTEEERQQALRQLASEIPSDKQGLWNWPVKWEFVDDAIIAEQLRPFVEKKIVEYLGVQEEMLVDVVEESVKKRANPQELVSQLEEALDEEAEVLVKKLWRMLIFFSENEKRGLSA